MDDARAFPEDHFDIGLGGDPTPEYWSGVKMTLSTPSDSTTATALLEVQVMSDSALTSAEVLT